MTNSVRIVSNGTCLGQTPLAHQEFGPIESERLSETPWKWAKRRTRLNGFGSGDGL
jgi:hypothetical protein